MTRDEARLVLDSELCWCHRRKLSGQPVCRVCWLTLDSALRMELREKIGNGFEQSYEHVLASVLKRRVTDHKPCPPKVRADIQEVRRA